jgi:hypothetical protein
MKSVLLFVLCVLSVVRSEDIKGKLYVLEGDIEYTAFDITKEPDFALIFAETPTTPLDAVLETGGSPREAVVFTAILDNPNRGKCQLGAREGLLKVFVNRSDSWSAVKLQLEGPRELISRNAKNLLVKGRLEPYKGLGWVSKAEVEGFTLRYPVPKKEITGTLCFKRDPKAQPPTETPSGPGDVPASADESEMAQAPDSGDILTDSGSGQ